MGLQAPTLSGISPAANDTDIVLKPTVEVVVGGQSLVDPLSWGPEVFALYGPGDFVLESGPGTILNSGLEDAPYPILDGPLRRDRIAGTYDVLISGTSGIATAETAIGTSGQLTLLRYTPSVPLLPNTEYTAVIVGDDAGSLDVTAERRFPGLTSFTSPSGFSQSGTLPAITSGFIKVARPYSKTLQTNQYDSTTGQNDTYTITVTSGTSSYGLLLDKGFKYQWSKASAPGTFDVVVSGTTDRNNLGDGLLIDFIGTFRSGEVHQLNTYIPQPLAVSVTWKFSTGEISSFGDPPPTVPGNISVVIDETAGGGFGVDTVEQLSGAQFYVIDSDPDHLEYDVATSLSVIELQFNQAIKSGVYSVNNVEVTSAPLLGIPVPEAASGITPTRLETSGAYLKIFLP